MRLPWKSLPPFAHIRKNRYLCAVERVAGTFRHYFSTFTFRFFGEMAEWSIAAVLKTVEGHTSGGSNPSLSAKKKQPAGLLFLRQRERDENPGVRYRAALSR